MKAGNIVAPAKTTKQAPDLEEAFEEEDDGEVITEPKDEDEELDLKKDKYIKQPKVKKPAAKKATKKGSKKDDETQGEDSEEEAKPKKARAKKAPPAKGKGKK
jgi:replication factor C subunit 1